MDECSEPQNLQKYFFIGSPSNGWCFLFGLLRQLLKVSDFMDECSEPQNLQKYFFIGSPSNGWCFPFGLLRQLLNVNDLTDVCSEPQNLQKYFLVEGADNFLETDLVDDSEIVRDELEDDFLPPKNLYESKNAITKAISCHVGVASFLGLTVEIALSDKNFDEAYPFAPSCVSICVQLPD